MERKDGPSTNRPLTTEHEVGGLKSLEETQCEAGNGIDLKPRESVGLGSITRRTMLGTGTLAFVQSSPKLMSAYDEISDFIVCSGVVG